MENTELVKSEGGLMDMSIQIYNNASMLKITDDEQTKLLASFDATQIEIRPDGLIYLPQTFWRQRLNTSFGIGQWCLVVKNSFKDPNTEKDKLYVEGILMVRGCYIATAVGEAELHTENPLQSWASVFESAKSDCITRCCKDLSIATELWQPQFIRDWVSSNAIQVFIKVKDRSGQEKTKTSWRKKTTAPYWNECGVVGGNKEPAKSNTSPAKETPSNTTESKPRATAGATPEKWLNKWTSKEQKETTKEWKNTVEKLMEGKITMANILSAYKLSIDIRAELEKIQPVIKLENVTEDILHEEVEFTQELPF